jgi:hypothetical protein
MAGTSLRRVLAELSAKTGKDFRQSLDIYAERLENVTSTSGKMAIATEAVGMRNKDVLLSLIANREKLDDLTVAYQNAGGSAAGMVTAMENNLSGDKKKMRSALEGLGITISETLGIEKAMRFVVTKFTGFVSSMEKFFGTLGIRAEKFGNNFKAMGGFIVKGVLEMRLAFIQLQRKISEIPLIGRAIDTDALDQSEKEIKESLDRTIGTLVKYSERNKEIQDEIALYGVEPDVTTEGDTAPVAGVPVTDEFIEGEAETDGDSDPLADRMRYLEKLRKAEEDFEDETHLAKMERARARAVEEATLLGANQEQLDTIRQSFQARIDAARQKDVDDHHKANQEKINKELENLDLMARIFGEESKMGKLALIAKAQMSKIEMKIDGEVTMSKMLKATAEAGVDYFKGIGKAASAAPFPMNVPLIAGHIATALPLFMQLRSVFKKNKATAGLKGGADIQTPSASLSGGGGNTVTAPEFNVVGQASAGENMIADTIASANQKPIRTYVVSTDVSNSQELERKAEGTASLG